MMEYIVFLKSKGEWENKMVVCSFRESGGRIDLLPFGLSLSHLLNGIKSKMTVRVRSVIKWNLESGPLFLPRSLLCFNRLNMPFRPMTSN